MRHIYSICGKLSLIFYIFAIYQLWHLCQYGGLRSHIIKLAVAVIIGAVTFILWITARHYERNSLQKADLKGVGKKKIFYAEIFIFVITTLFFGGRIIYSGIPYNGALSWKDSCYNDNENIAYQKPYHKFSHSFSLLCLICWKEESGEFQFLIQ